MSNAANMVPNADILTSLLERFTSVTANSTNLIHGFAWKVLVILIAVDLIVAVLIMLMEDAALGQAVFRRVLKYSAFTYMVFDYKFIINAFGDSFVLIGLKAAGSTLTDKMFTNPSKITDLGFAMISTPIQSILVTDGSAASNAAGTLANTITSFPTMLIMIPIYFMILFCFFAIAINIFVVYIEWAILTSIALILVPFGVWDKTEFIFEKAKNGIITYGIKFMTLAFVTSISLNIIQTFRLPPNPGIHDALYILVGMLAITYLCFHAPSIAAGIASGSGGTVTAAAAVGFAAAAGRNTGITKAAKAASTAAAGAATGGAAAVGAKVAAKVGAWTGSEKAVGGKGASMKSGDTGNSSITAGSQTGTTGTTDTTTNSSPTSSGVSLGSTNMETGPSTDLPTEPVKE